jgi:hypothetical protein
MQKVDWVLTGGLDNGRHKDLREVLCWLNLCESIDRDKVIDVQGVVLTHVDSHDGECAGRKQAHPM